MEGYTFEDMWLDLKNGYQIYYTYVRNRYVLFKTAKNCYTQKLLSDDPKNPQPRMTMLTLKRVKEMFPYMEQIEYKVIEGEAHGRNDEWQKDSQRNKGKIKDKM